MDTSDLQIIKALESDSEQLTLIAFAAKRHWNYPESYYEIWKNELTVTSSYIRQNIVFKALYNGSMVGFYSIVENKNDFYSGEIFVKKGFWLEHIFILPAFHHQGFGRMLMDHVKATSRNMGVAQLLIFVDPFAKGFYDKVGADFLYDSKSSILGRLIPVYELNVL
jgi:maltose O-acetyltransferase